MFGYLDTLGMWSKIKSMGLSMGPQSGILIYPVYTHVRTRAHASKPTRAGKKQGHKLAAHTLTL